MLIDVKRRRPTVRPTISSQKIRSSLQQLVDGQLENINSWLEQTATGIPKTNSQGEVVRDNDGAIVWVNRPDPATAVKLVNDLAEYVIPRLTRSDQSVAIQVENVSIEDMSTPALQRRLLVALGLDAIESGAVIEGEAIPAPDQSKP